MSAPARCAGARSPTSRSTSPGAVVRLEERFHFAAHIDVAAALPIEHRVQRRLVAVDRGGEDLLNTLPTLGRHRCGRVTSFA